MASYVVTLKCVERKEMCVLLFLAMWSKSTGRQNPWLYTRLHTVVQLVHTAVVHVHRIVQSMSGCAIGVSTRGFIHALHFAMQGNTTVYTQKNANRMHSQLLQTQSHVLQTVSHSPMTLRTFHHWTHVLNITTV